MKGDVVNVTCGFVIDSSQFLLQVNFKFTAEDPLDS